MSNRAAPGAPPDHRNAPPLRQRDGNFRTIPHRIDHCDQYHGTVSDSPRPPARSAVVTLFAVAATAVVAGAVLTAVAVAKAGPSRATVESGDRSSPTPRTSSSRAAGLPMCLVGSWRSVEERAMVKFYSDADPILMTTSGRRYEFRPDGTGTERQENVVHTGSHQGNEIRLVANGTIEFTWKATDKQITYLARTSTTLVFTSYDQRGEIGSQPLEAKPDLNEVDDYTCQGNQAVESNSSGYQSHWVRTDGSGVYG